MQGNLHWQQQSESWVFSSPMLALHTANIKTQNKAQFTLPKNDQPVSLSLHSYFYDGHDASQIPRYLPVGIINNAPLVDWLDNAFLAGDVNQGHLIFRGALKDYPFTHNKGVFEVLFNANNVDLQYAKDWQPIEDLSADIRFFAKSMEINIHQGTANQTIIQQAQVKIDSFSNSEYISISGDVKGDLGQAIGFLQQTPYQEKITRLNELIDMQGLFSAHIDLGIPLRKMPTKINIISHPQDAQLRISPVDVQVTDINGALHITEEGIFCDNFTGQALGFPIQAKINSDKQSTSIQLSGQASILRLAEQFPSEYWKQLSGTSDYQLQLNTPIDPAEMTKLQLFSDLKGTQINFPAFAKAPQHPSPFSLDLDINSSGIEALSIHVKNLSSSDNNLDIKLNKTTSRWQGYIHSAIAYGTLNSPIEFNKNSDIELLFQQLDLSAFKNINLSSSQSFFTIKDWPRLQLKSQSTFWQKLI